MDDVLSRLRARLARDVASRSPVGFTFNALPPATIDAVEHTERQLEFRLPAMLRRIYLEVANGGFGPGYGVMGVHGGFTDDLGHNIADIYATYRQGDPEDPSWLWQDRQLPICHWGCAIYSVVDCTKDELPVYFVDPGGKQPGMPMESVIESHKPSLESWLSDWLDGKDLWKQVFGR